MTIKAIETSYAGCRFRSRTEARWAVLFDALKIRWEYELEGFELPSGRYLPDFLLPDYFPRGVWFEVKHGDACATDPRWNDLALMTQRPIIVSFGTRHPDDLARGGLDQIIGPECCITGGLGFYICQACGHLDIDIIDEARRCEICGGNERDFGHPRLAQAYGAARSARFEYGESGVSQQQQATVPPTTRPVVKAFLDRLFPFGPS